MPDYKQRETAREEEGGGCTEPSLEPEGRSTSAEHPGPRGAITGAGGKEGISRASGEIKKPNLKNWDVYRASKAKSLLNALSQSIPPVPKAQ
jgi:hypothetical protein